MSKKALITGITGQDGSYLAEHLLDLGYEVHGIRRRASTFNSGRIEHLLKSGILPVENLHYADLTDFSSIFSVIQKVLPNEIYHLAAQSHVGVSFENPEYTGNLDALGTLRLLEAVRIMKSQEIRIYQASTSELFGRNTDFPQNEKSVFMPCSPYAVAKQYAFNIIQIYRDAYGIFASNGILFNHESPRRGETFVTRKITRHVARQANGENSPLILGNLDAIRDWGHAQDFVKGMHAILNHPIPDDFVLATGVGRTVRQFVIQAYAEIGIEIEWLGEAEAEVGVNQKTGKVLIEVSREYFRPLEVPILIGDSSKANSLLGWKPKVTFEDLVRDMVREDLRLNKFS